MYNVHCTHLYTLKNVMFVTLYTAEPCAPDNSDIVRGKFFLHVACRSTYVMATSIWHRELKYFFECHRSPKTLLRCRTVFVATLKNCRALNADIQYWYNIVSCVPSSMLKQLSIFGKGYIFIKSENDSILFKYYKVLYSPDYQHFLSPPPPLLPGKMLLTRP